MHVQVYLIFEGKCEEAITFYQEVFGTKLEMLMRYSESPQAQEPGMIKPENMDKVMHCSFRIGDTEVMASDGMCAQETKFQGFSLHVTAADPAAADGLFNALAEGGKISMPMSETFWAKRFGMVADKFGIHWMISVPAGQ